MYYIKMLKNRIEEFTPEEYLLFSKISVATYDSPIDFLKTSSLFRPNTTASDFNKKRSTLISGLRRTRKKYCGRIDGTTSDLYGFYITNSHDLNCYVFKYNNNIYVSFRGTSSLKQLIRDTDCYNGNVENIIKKIEKNVSPESEGVILLKHLISNNKNNTAIIFPGFAKTLFTSLQIINYCLVKLIKESSTNVRIYTTGHSLGGALCTLYGFAVSYGIYHMLTVFDENVVKKINLPINVCSLGSPKVGNDKFIELYKLFIESNLIRLSRVVSKSKITGFIDTAVQYPPSKKFYMSPGFSNKKTNLKCNDIVKQLVDELDELKFPDEYKEQYMKQAIKHCLNDNNFKDTHKLEHPSDDPIINIEETKKINQQCNFPSGTLCHGKYFNVSFMHLGTRMMTNKPAYKLFNINDFQTGLGLMYKNTVSFMVTGDKNVSTAEKAVNSNKILNNKCKQLNKKSTSIKNNGSKTPSPWYDMCVII